MKKIWSILGVFFLILLIFQTPTIVKAADKAQVQNYQVEAQIQKNGDIELTQRVNYQFNTDLHGVYYNQDLTGIKGATQPKVSVDEGYRKLNLKQSQSGENNTFKVTKTKKKLSLKVYHNIDADDNQTFIYKYRLLGAITNYRDTAEMNWQIIGNGWDNDLNNVKLTISLPQKKVPQLKAWTHGPMQGHTKVDRKNGRVILTVRRVPANTAVESHLIFPTSVTATNPNVVQKNAKTRIMQAEKQKVLAANRQRQHQDWIYLSLMVLGGLVIAILYLIRFREFQRNSGQKHKIPTPLYHVFDEPKFLPSFTKVILERMDKADSQSLMADLMNEVGQRHMKIDRIGSSYEITALTPPTNPFFQYLINDIGDGQTVSLKEIRRASQAADYSDEDNLNDHFDDWAESAASGRERYLDLSNMAIVSKFKVAAITTDVISFIMIVITMLFAKSLLLATIIWITVAILAWVIWYLISKRVTPYTDLGEQEVNQIRAFRRMLEDIDDIKLAEVGDIILWEKFIPYAMVFGISDKVIKALRVNFTPEQLNDSFIIPYFIGANSFFNTTKGGFQTSFIGALSAGGSSSISGGSGGFSGGSSGGFGGGSGGGVF